MRNNKQEVYEMIFSSAKEMMLNIAGEYSYDIAMCLSLKQLKKIVRYYESLYEYAINYLYDVESFEEMEKVIAVMNVLFDNRRFQKVKDELYQCLIGDLSVEKYCVLRHLSDENESDLIHHLYQYGYADALSCAKFCFIEDDIESAVYYLKQLDTCEDEAVLDLLASYSFSQYVKLMVYYKKKEKNMVLAYS